VTQMVIFNHFKNKKILKKVDFSLGVIVFEDEQVPSAPRGKIGGRAGTGAAAGIVDYENLKSTKRSIDDLPQNIEFAFLNRKDFVGLGIERKRVRDIPSATCQPTSCQI